MTALAAPRAAPRRARLLDLLRRSALAGFAVDLREWVRRPRLQQDLWRDFLRTWREAAVLRDLPPGGDRAALVISFGTIGQTKMEGILAAGLRRQGWTVAAFTSRTLPWIRRYYRAYGVTRHFLTQDFQVDTATAARCAREAADYLGGDLSFRAVKGWTYRGVRIGAPLLANIQRTDLLGTPDPADPAVHAGLTALLPRILAWVHQSERLLDAARPQLMLLTEANDWNAPLVDLALARGIDIVQFVQPSRDDALILKRLNAETRRFHPSSLTPGTLARLAAEPWTAAQEAELEQEFADRYGGRWFLQRRNQPGTQAKSRDEIMAALGLDPAKKTAAVFSHIIWDANLFFGEDLFEDYADWLVQTARAAAANPALNWIFKLHPANVWKRAYVNEAGELAEFTVLRRAGLLPLPGHVALVEPQTDISTLSLFQNIDYGITVRGTTGLELPCFGVPSLTAGTGRYSGLGFTRDFASKEDYLACLARLQEMPSMTPEETLQARRHAHALFRRRPWVFTSFRSTFNLPKQGSHPLAYNFALAARSWAEIDANGDLRRFADWAGDPARPADYLE